MKYVVKEMTFSFEGRQIKICMSVLEIIMEYLQKDKSATEAGGLIIGRENKSNSNLIIEFVTTPMPGDLRMRNRYFRKDKKHVQDFNELYEKSSGTYVYIGEWHTHPEAIPHYSFIDTKNWRKIGKNAPPNSRQYHLIAGYDALRIWEYSYIERRSRIVGTVKWNEAKNDKVIEE